MRKNKEDLGKRVHAIPKKHVPFLKKACIPLQHFYLSVTSYILPHKGSTKSHGNTSQSYLLYLSLTILP